LKAGWGRAVRRARCLQGMLVKVLEAFHGFLQHLWLNVTNTEFGSGNEVRVWVNFKTHNGMTCQHPLNQRSPHASEGIEECPLQTQKMSLDYAPDKITRKPGNPGNPTMDWQRFIRRKSRIIQRGFGVVCAGFNVQTQFQLHGLFVAHSVVPPF